MTESEESMTRGSKVIVSFILAGSLLGVSLLVYIFNIAFLQSDLAKEVEGSVQVTYKELGDDDYYLAAAEEDSKDDGDSEAEDDDVYEMPQEIDAETSEIEYSPHFREELEEL